MGLVRGVARTAAIAGTATAVSNRVSRRQAGRWAEQEAAAAPPPAAVPVQAPAPVAAAPARPDMDTKLAQLKDLGDLRDQGVLSQEEFDQQKDRILSA